MIFLGLENIIKVYFYEDKVNNKKKNVKIPIHPLAFHQSVHSTCLALLSLKLANSHPEPCQINTSPLKWAQFLLPSTPSDSTPLQGISSGCNRHSGEQSLG